MNRSTIVGFALPLLASAGLIGCGAHARTPDEYRDATASVLATRSDQVRSCYDAAYKADPSSQGTVTVQFTVEKDTGKFVGAQVVSGTAPDALKQCILRSFDGAVLAPGDGQDGDATFEWEFVPPKPAV
jgi:hypothetical protein